MSRSTRGPRLTRSNVLVSLLDLGGTDRHRKTRKRERARRVPAAEVDSASVGELKSQFGHSYDPVTSLMPYNTLCRSSTSYLRRSSSESDPLSALEYRC